MKLIRVIKQTTRLETTTAIFECPLCGKEFVTTLKNAKRTKSCGCLKKTETYLGPGLCARGHDYNGTGRSLRYKKSKECVMCAKVRNKDRHYKGEQYKKKTINNEREARANASLNCVNHGKCLDIAAKGIKRMKCHNCPDYKEEVAVWQKEPGVDVLLTGVSEITEYRISEQF